MAKNPLGAFGATTRMPQDEPHHRAEGMASHPMHKHKVRHKGRHPVEMSRSHGARASAAGRDMLASSDKHPKLPGLKEPSGRVKAVGKMVTPHRGPGSVR